MSEHETNLARSSQAYPEACLLGGAGSCKVDNINHNKGFFSLYFYVDKENVLHTGSEKQALTLNRHGKIGL